jgi:FtsZ-interacting cell division protein ZipA
MVRTKQGGSILGFILIGVVLAALLVGGVYFVRQQTAKQTKQQPAPTESTSSQQPSSSDTSESPAPVTEDKSTNKDVSDKKEKTSADNTPAETNNSQPSNQTATELPKTGSSQTIGALIMTGILSYVVVLYARSRRLNLSF